MAYQFPIGHLMPKFDLFGLSNSISTLYGAFNDEICKRIFVHIAIFSMLHRTFFICL